jgi:hypothetical protein
MSVSLAFFSAGIIGNGKNVSVNAKELTINFDNNNEIASGIIEPGWSSANTFSITNKSKTNFTYDIVLKNYKNTTKTNGYLVYKITSTNGYNMTEFKDMPKDGENTYDLVIARGITIEPGSSNKQSYTLEIKYLDSTEDQSIDMGSTVTGSLYIVESTTNENNQYTKGTLGYQIMEDNSNIKERTDFSKTYTDVNIGTMYKATEDNTDVYYFAGDARNNWVKFGGYYWRIIRTNSDGSIRLLYHGTSPETQNAYIGDSEIAFNENYNDSMYVGYKYGTSGSLENNRSNTNDSTIKKTIDAWYKDNLVNYTKYLSTSAVYCNDRELGSGTYSATGDKFYYVGYTRLGANKNPSYNCTNEYDAFSVNNTKAQLTYPIALMTADEISYAGGVWIKNAATWYYLNSKGNASIKNGQNEWWLLSAASWDTDKSSVVFKISSAQDRKAQFGAQSVQYKLHVRPVISLKSDVLHKSGDGSATNPYEIQETPDTIYERLLLDKSTRPGERTDFSTVLTTDNTKTLYTGTEEGTTIYYFAGNATDNWVKLGGYYWRIIRTNADRSVRLLYHGTSTDTTEAYINSSTAFNSSHTDSMYVGYMYGTSGSLESNRANTNNSTIKEVIDSWYASNMTSYAKYLSETAIYCSDREVGEGTYTATGLKFYYAPYTRIDTNKAATYGCTATEDKFTVDSAAGNGKLTYPIALMTVDELVFAGGAYREESALTWYYYNSVKGSSTGKISWWLMSPYDWGANSSVFRTYGSDSPGYLYARRVDDTLGVRPVISIKGNNLWKSGDGTASSPYEIVTN